MSSAAAPLQVAVPDLPGYSRRSGIGRVFESLRAHWNGEVTLHDAQLRSSPLPYLRGYPHAVEAPAGCELVLLPRILGATALKDTGGLPSLMVVHDVGGMEKAVSGDRSVNFFNTHTVTRHFYATRHASHVVTVSEFTRERLLVHLPELAGRVTVIPNGVDEAFLEHPTPRAEARRLLAARLGREPSGPVLIYVGSESPRKNLPLLLELFRRVKQQHPGAVLVKIGTPDHKLFRQNMLDTLRRLGLTLGRDVVLLEQLSDHELRDCYRAADLFVSTSLYEGFGLPAVEAMALGTPVLVTNRGAFPEVVGDGGMSVEPELRSLLRAVDAMLEPESWRQWSQRAHDRARRFSWSAAAKRYVELMRRLAAEAQPKARNDRTQVTSPRSEAGDATR